MCVSLHFTITPQTMDIVIVRDLSKLNDAIDVIQVSGLYTCVCAFLHSVIHSHCVSQRNRCASVVIAIPLDENQSKRLWSAIMVCMCVLLPKRLLIHHISTPEKEFNYAPGQNL